MEILVILIVVMIVVGGVQLQTKKQNADAYYRLTRTNRGYQDSVESAITRIVDQDIAKLVAQGYSQDEAIRELFKRFIIPTPEELSETPYKYMVSEDNKATLIKLMVIRSLSRCGYSYTSSRRESQWQELKKTSEHLEQITIKYPWL